MNLTLRRTLIFTRVVAAVAALFVFIPDAPAANVVTIGDSLTAEYDTIPDVPGFDNLPTGYAKVTVPGWEAMSWVEVAGRLRGRYFNFGGWRSLSNPWPVPRLSGYEYNWAIPGVTAAQYEDFVTSSLLSNPFYYSARQSLEDQLAGTAQRVVIWLGGNDFRANYGALYDGASSDAFVNGLIDDLGKIIDFVQQQNGSAQLVIANLPDLGAAPSVKAAHPDPAKRLLVSAVAQLVNLRLAELAATKGIAVADTHAISAALVNDEPLYFGGVRILNARNADNHPRYAFARDGLHPNTAVQILNLRAVIRAFNQGYGGGIPNITDFEALRLLRIDPDQPFFDWLLRVGITNQSFQADLDGDRLSQLAEYAFGLDPNVADAARLPVKVEGPVPGFTGDFSVRFTPRAIRSRYVAVRVQYSSDANSWNGLPPDRMLANADGSFTAVIPPLPGAVYLRLRVVTIPPNGSGARNTSYITLR